MISLVIDEVLQQAVWDGFNHCFLGLGILQKNAQSPRAVIFSKHLHFVLLLVPLLSVPGAVAATDFHPYAMATLSSRSARPGDHLEMVVTVHQATTLPSLHLPATIEGLHLHLLHKPQLLEVDQESVWLFRYRIIPAQIGDVEIPSLQIIAENRTVETKPMLLHISKTGERTPLSAKDLARGVNIPEALSEEVLKAVPQATPKPTPSPSPPDTRGLGTKFISSFWNGLKAFWNYPGK